jgi:hypothetical protein
MCADVLPQSNERRAHIAALLGRVLFDDNPLSVHRLMTTFNFLPKIVFALLSDDFWEPYNGFAFSLVERRKS